MSPGVSDPTGNRSCRCPSPPVAGSIAAAPPMLPASSRPMRGLPTLPAATERTSLAFAKRLRKRRLIRLRSTLSSRTPGRPIPGLPTRGRSIPGRMGLPTLGRSIPGRMGLPTLGRSIPGRRGLSILGRSIPGRTGLPTLGRSIPGRAGLPTLGRSTPGRAGMPTLDDGRPAVGLPMDGRVTEGLAAEVGRDLSAARPPPPPRSKSRTL